MHCDQQPRSRVGVMAAPYRRPGRGLMAVEPSRRRGVFSADPGAFEGFDPHAELRRLAWSAVAVLVVVLWLWHHVAV